MSKTKAQKKAAAKSTKAKPASAKKTKTAPPVETKITGECPKGGDHELTEDDGERFCGKCKAPAEAKPAKKKAMKAEVEPNAKKLSAIDAAAQVLAGAKEPMNARQLIEALAAQGLWTSPGGKTPHATLYSAILREIGEKGNESRFVKTERGKFAANAA